MKKTILSSLLVLLALIGSAPAIDSSTGPAYAPNEILIKFREPAAKAVAEHLKREKPARELGVSLGIDQLNAAYRLREIKPLFKDFKKNRLRLKTLQNKDKSLLTKKEKYILRRRKRAPKDAKVPDLSRIYKIELDLDPDQTLEEAIVAYHNHPDVEYAELNYVVSIDLTPNDPLYPIQWPLNNTGQMYPETGYYYPPPGTPDCDIDAPEAWDINTGSWEVVIAVVDTGVDYNHRDLQANMWTDTNGFYGRDFVNNDNNPMDDRGHGTHCAGIIAAEGNNGLDITGVCWNARIMGLKVLDSGGSGSYSDAATAFYYAVENGADVLSNSWGGSNYSETLEQAVDYAHSMGVITVAAAGNEFTDSAHYPAYYEHVIAVAATYSDGKKASFSNYGDWVDIAAPGVDVLSLRASGTSYGTPYDDYTTILTGTSMACPHAAGVVGLLLSHYPDVAIEQIRARLLVTADDALEGIPYLGGGRINAYKALRTTFEGVIKLDSDSYSCDDIVSIEVIDLDLRGQATENVMVITDGNDLERITLAQDANKPWIFTGTIITSAGPVAVGDGILQVAHGQIIAAVYYDSDDGTGNPATPEATAVIDCQGPLIFNVGVERATSSGAVITFETDEFATARVRCGLACGGPYSIVEQELDLAKSHRLQLTVPASQMDYYFVVDANDALANESMDSNTGQCYPFTTTTPPVGLHVPAEYPTIQAAIDDACNGDVIWVADGVYTGEGNRDIDFKGKAITVRNETGPVHCIIDCENLGRGFYFHNGEDNNSVLDGFTITNGRTFGDQYRYGGGIACKNSGPTINNCIITGNTAHNSGGGIAGSHAIISNCIVSNNTATGIWAGDATIVNCIISDNTNLSEGAGGITCWSDSDAIIQNCIIKNNVSMGNARGGGIRCTLCSPTIVNCLIIGNSAAGYYGGGGIWTNSASPIITNCSFVGNSTTGRGGGAWFRTNRAITVTNCIFWGNYPCEIFERKLGDRPLRVSYSNVKGGWTGAGNIDTSPQFVDASNGDHHLMGGSPCIDAGTNSPTGGLPAADLEGIFRPLDGDLDGNSVADMGAYEYWAADSRSPVINATPNTILISTLYHGPGPDEQILSVRNGGPGTLVWQITEDCSWLEVTPAAGQSSGETNEVTLSVDSVGLSCGQYHCELVISDPCAINSPQTVAVTLHVLGPVIELSEEEFEFTVLKGGMDPADQILTINNSGLGTLQWEISHDCDWLRAEPTSGSWTREANQVVLSVDVEGLSWGTYDCELAISEPHACNSPQMVVATLHVVGPVIELSAGDFEFTTLESGVDPTDRILTINNSGAGMLEWEITSDCNWLWVDPVSGSSTGETVQVVLGVDTAGLNWGRYDCELTVSDPCATNSPQAVEVTLHIGDCFLVPSEYGTVQAAIDAAQAGTAVVIAPGTYTGDGNRDLDFGGKAITVRSTDPDDPAVVAATVIDCESSGRAFYFHSGETAYSVVAGLTITNGYALYGAGIFCEGSSPTISRCTFSASTAEMGGGGIENFNCSPLVTNCLFTGNVSGGSGGAIEDYNSSATVRSCVFWGNMAGAGGGVQNVSSTVAIINCTFSENYADQGGGIHNYDSPSSTVTNCILWDNAAYEAPEIYGTGSTSYSDVKGGCSGEGNIDVDPCFVAPAAGDYHLRSEAGRWDPHADTWVTDANTSLCVDAGDPNSDWAAELWPHGKLINMGAFGGTPQASMSLSNTGNIADLNNDDSVNWQDLKLFTDKWLCQQALLSEDLDRTGVVDFADFAIFTHNWSWQE